jgi:hypothetical protein
MVQAKSTAPIKALFDEALDTVTKRTPDIIEDVFFAIEHGPEWRRRYDELCERHGKTTVNTWGGFWVAHAVERAGERQVPAHRSTLIQTYSILDQPAPPPKSKKASDETARELVWAYYKERKDSLPAGIAGAREEIVAMMIAGMSAEEAFSAAVNLLSN